MCRPSLEVADVIRVHGEELLERYGRVLSSEQKYALKMLAACRTATLGGHVLECEHCGHRQPEYNSCRNRHCPKCQGAARAEWVAARQKELLPVPYFHVVFTLPHALSDLALQNPRLVYNLLFAAAWQTLRKVAADPKHLGARIGMVAVLHTWGQNLQHHPHLHCLVPGGGLSPHGTRWVGCRSRRFFLPVRVLSRVFRGKFVDGLRRAYRRGELTLAGGLAALEEGERFQAWVDQLYQHDWTVYAKPPFGSSKRLVKYLARYTHRVAISNRRLVKLENGRVTFLWKDYRRGPKWRTMTLKAVEFLRRFLLHVLPKGLMRIRQYGYLANCCRKRELARCRQLLGVDSTGAERVAEETPVWDAEPDRCVSDEQEGPSLQRTCPACGRSPLYAVWARRRPTAQEIYKTSWSDLMDTS